MKFAENLYYVAYIKHLRLKIKFFAENRETIKAFSSDEIDKLLKILNEELELLQASQPRDK